MPHKFIISGGGTGGHIFPAIAIANELKNWDPDCEILFIGAKNRMEMEKVPHEGYNIIGLDIAGLRRSLSLHNFTVLFKFLKSYIKARKILKKFKPDCVIGTGGFASLPVLYAAGRLGFKSLIWEGNGFAGLANRIIAKRVNTICTGFAGMEQHLPAEKIVITGNPVRKEIIDIPSKETGIQFFSLLPSKPVIFITGGSLGAKTINIAIQEGLPKLEAAGIQIIWQTGKNFKATVTDPKTMKAMIFLREMNMAYAAADLVISRAGALSIAEIAACGKPAILVPSPNVTDDHQTKNALKLTDIQAAALVTDLDAGNRLIDTAISLLQQPENLQLMQEKIKTLAKPEATNNIILEIQKLLQS